MTAAGRRSVARFQRHGTVIEPRGAATEAQRKSGGFREGSVKPCEVSIDPAGSAAWTIGCTMTGFRDLPSLATVDRTIAGGFRFLAFPADLERFFEAECNDQRNIDLARRGFLSLILFDLFLFVDAAVTPDVFPLAMVLRLAVITPM